MTTDLTEDDIERRLAGGAARGPRAFRGRPLATYKLGIRDLLLKVITPADSAACHDCTLLYLLQEAYAEEPPAPAGGEKGWSLADVALQHRRRLIAATDDVDGFRARISLDFIDELSPEDLAEARRLVDEILADVEAARVKIIGQKKSASAAPAATTPTTTPSPSSRSRRKPAGLPTSSAGS